MIYDEWQVTTGALPSVYPYRVVEIQWVGHFKESLEGNYPEDADKRWSPVRRRWNVTVMALFP